jgi:hypothetical protein
VREAPVQNLVVSESDVTDLAKQVSDRLEKVQALAANTAMCARASEFLRTVAHIQSNGGQPEDRYRDLRDLEFHAVNDLYRDTVVAHRNRGLLSEG